MRNDRSRHPGDLVADDLSARRLDLDDLSALRVSSRLQ
jgi:hypothetical protein